MKRFLTIVLALIGLVLIALWVLGKDTRTIATTIEIETPVEEVWAKVSEFNSWTEWNPTVTKTSGGSALGETVEITIAAEDGSDGPAYQAVIIESDAPETLRWRAKMLSEIVFRNDRVFLLEPIETGTRLTHSEEFSGMMVPLMWGFFEAGVPKILDAMNVALKETVEGG